MIEDHLHLSALLLAAIAVTAPLEAQLPDLPAPTIADVPYGPHPRQVLDFWQAETDDPAPWLFFIHGGGWMVGDKANPNFLNPCLENGISVVSINYRFLPDAMAENIDPPVQACLNDAARALQFVRNRSGEWHLLKGRVVVCGGSAGGFGALWLAFHPEMGNPNSQDPVARESTRVSGAMAFAPQTSLDPRQMKEWIPNNDYGHHAFALPTAAEFLDRRESLMPWIRRFSPYELASADDPPVYLFYDSVPSMGHPSSDPAHSANFGVGLAKRLAAVGIEHELNYPGAQGVRHPDIFGFVREKLATK